MEMENSGGYLSPSESSYKDPNRASLTDDKSKEPKKRGGSRKRGWIGIISKNYLPIMDPKTSAKN